MMHDDEIHTLEKDPDSLSVYGTELRTLPERQISPILTQEQYRARNLCYMTPEMGANEIEPNVIYRDGNQIKFLLLPKALPNSHLRMLEILKNADWKNCARAANGQKHGKKITVGWLPQKAYRVAGSGYKNIRTAQTLEQPELMAGLYPMLREMNVQVAEHLPSYFKFAFDAAMCAVRPEGEEDDLSRVPKRSAELRPKPILTEESPDEELTESNPLLPNPYGIVKGIDPWNWLYTIKGTIFSTVELNRNIVFKAHHDGTNVDGTCVCITALGAYVGGRLVFPRYGYSAELQPTDLLICDNNHELHGNLGPIVGERFSVVAYLYAPLLGRAEDEQEDEWRLKCQQELELERQTVNKENL